MMEEEKVEVEGENFIEQDIDENPGQDTTDVNLASINKSFVPRIFEGRKLPQTPGFSHRKLLSVMKKEGSPARESYKPAIKSAEKNKETYLTLLVKSLKQSQPTENQTKHELPGTIREVNPSKESESSVILDTLDDKITNTNLHKEEVKQAGKCLFKASLLLKGNCSKIPINGQKITMISNKPIVKNKTASIRNALRGEI